MMNDQIISREAFVCNVVLAARYTFDFDLPPLEPGKASDWFQKGAVIGYKKDEIQVSTSHFVDLLPKC